MSDDSSYTEALRYLLIKAAEEASEVAQAFGKAALFGLESSNPLTGKTNVAQIVGEMNDLRGVLMLIQALSRDRLSPTHQKQFQLIDSAYAFIEKQKKVCNYARHSVQTGMLSNEAYLRLLAEVSNT